MILGLFLIVSLECSTFVWSRPQTQDVTFRKLRTIRSSEEEPVRIERLKVHSVVVFRYATTIVSSTVFNSENTPNQAKFSVLLPESAFITGFTLDVSGKVYNSFVKERQKAHHLYQQAVENGLTAGHLAVSARDSSHFLISVNLEGSGRATFNLTYEQLLNRKLGLYNHVINLHPGQVVPDLSVVVQISESHPMTKLTVLPFHTGGQLFTEYNDTVWDQVFVERPSKKKAVVRFDPSSELQSQLEVDKGEGLAGQLIIRYDVDNHSPGGTILVNEGYFVHFAAPSELPPLRKHVIFTLDVSGSMTGRKLQQLKEAMTRILDDLEPADSFNIIEFSYAVTVWNLDSLSSSAVIQPEIHSTGLWWYNKAELPPTSAPSTTPDTLPLSQSVPPYPATHEYIRKAKDVIEKMTAGGGTNIHGALRTAMLAAAASSNTSANSTTTNPEPIVIFLTDGDPTIGITDPNKILNMVKSETEPIDDISADLYGLGGSGEESDGEDNKEKKRKKKKKTKGTLERLWAFLTIQQLLEKKQVLETEDVKKKVLELALKYNFVTPMTSLIVVKPNQSVEIDQDSLKPQSMKNRIYTGNLMQNRRPSPTRIQYEGTNSFMEESTTKKFFLMDSWGTRNLTLDDIRWLDGLIDKENGTVTLPLGVNGTNQQYRLGLDQDDWPLGECVNLHATVSHCRHLPYCVLPDILSSVSSYIRYYCPLPNGYAGICCPDNRVSTTTEKVETTTGDTAATTIELTTQV